MAKSSSTVQRFILLPARGLELPDGPETTAMAMMVRLDTALHRTAHGVRAATVSLTPRAKLKVIDSISDTGAKLVEMTAEQSRELRAEEPGLRIVPEVFYQPALHRPSIESRVAKKTARASVKTELVVLAKTTQEPIRGAHVVAFTDYEGRAGAEGTTNALGKVSLSLGGSRQLDRLYVFPEMGFWGLLRRNLTVRSGQVLELDPIELAFVDCVRFFYGAPSLEEGNGVTVGVVDSGVAPEHPDLAVDGGLNTVPGEDPSDFGDNGGHHGTHVAGIIAGRGTPPAGIRGVAPGVRLRSYRVFGRDSDGASNYSIAKAIAAAVADGCDLLNLSLGGPDADDATRSAIADARAAGVVVIAAAGNDYRSPVSFPAADPRALAVAAMGRKGTFPARSEAEGDVAAPYGKDSKNFIAAFSNCGPEVDLLGPGVGVISTVPGGHAIMSGTSMACPAVTGAAARLLAAAPGVLSMARNQARSDAIAKLVLQSAKSLGFAGQFEGSGMP